ncbi:GIDE domain-containing protein [Candidatus Omnitrophota bacterium]
MEREAGNIIFFCIAGICAFFWGFTRLRRKRLIENIPTSTIRSLAMGLVELIGKAEKKIELMSPLSEAKCVFYKYLIERLTRSGKSSTWVTIAKGDSAFAHFFLDDGTGRVLVSPGGAELHMPVDYTFTTSWGCTIPENIVKFMEFNKIKYKGIFGRHTLRFQEWVVEPGETVYVLGAAKKCRDFLSERNKKLVSRLEALKADPKKMAGVDLNKDGEISLEEWDAARNKVERELIEEEIKSGAQDELADVEIGKGETEKTFIISDRGQEELINKLKWQAIGGIYGGAVVALIAALILLNYFGILRF